jgi:hypothetical protein
MAQPPLSAQTPPSIPNSSSSSSMSPFYFYASYFFNMQINSCQIVVLQLLHHHRRHQSLTLFIKISTLLGILTSRRHILLVLLLNCLLRLTIQWVYGHVIFFV